MYSLRLLKRRAHWGIQILNFLHLRRYVDFTVLTRAVKWLLNVGKTRFIVRLFWFFFSFGIFTWSKYWTKNFIRGNWNCRNLLNNLYTVLKNSRAFNTMNTMWKYEYANFSNYVPLVFNTSLIFFRKYEKIYHKL